MKLLGFKIIRALFGFLFTVGLLSSTSCSHKFNNPVLPKIFLPPAIPSNPSPPDKATNQPVSLTLSWTCTDPNPSEVLTYDVRLKTFTDTLPMNQALSSPNCVISGLSPNTTYLWQVIARNTKGQTTQGHLWEFSTGVWSQKGSLPTPRMYLAAGVTNGRLYAIGGWNGGAYLPAVVMYDPITDQWFKRASLTTPRAYLAVGALAFKLYALGGWDGTGPSSVVEEYDPLADTWVFKRSMPTPRHGLAAGVVNGKIYAIGGYNTTGGYLATVEEYDPATDTWSSKASMPTARCMLTVGVLNNKIYAVGGQNGAVPLSTVEEYDPSTNTWTSKAPMPTPRAYLAAEIVNGKLYALGGWCGSPLSAVEEYDPGANAWIQKTSMLTGRLGLAAGEMDQKIYAIGGGDTQGQAYSVVEEYDPLLDP